VRWVDNLLYLYTQPFDIVVDPFGGGGSTIDICKKRFRRYWVGDRKPVPERAHQIRQHDLTTGIPPLPRWQDVKLVYLDPPYWKQAEGQYSNDTNDLANMPLEQFTETLAGVITGFAKKLKPGAVIALILQPTQWKAEQRQYTDHVADMIRAVKLPLDLRVQCPYESQQCTAQMVDWAKANRKVLVLSRELVIWRVE
jgi:DNA modification methylase